MNFLLLSGVYVANSFVFQSKKQYFYFVHFFSREVYLNRIV